MLPWCSKRTPHNSNTRHDCSTRHFPDALSTYSFVTTLSPICEFCKFPIKALFTLKSSQLKTTSLAVSLAQHQAGRTSASPGDQDLAFNWQGVVALRYMRVMDELTESRQRTPSFQHAGAQSPRVGGCVGAFFNMFDWNSSKRFSSTKRITAERPNSDTLYTRRDRSFTERSSTTTLNLPLINEEKDEAISTSKNTPTLHCTASPASVKSDDTSKRVPGVVARLMGLESLPDGTYSSSKCESQYLQSTLASEQLDSPPVLLQELLRQDFQHSKKSLKEKLPGFAKKPQDSKTTRGPVSQRKKSTGHFGEHAHPYGDSRASRPGRSSEKKTSSGQEENKVVAKQPFLARLGAGTPTLLPSKSQKSNSPLLSPSVLGGKNTVRLLEAAVKSLEPSMLPSPRSRYCLSRESQSENGASFRSEKRVITSSHGRSLSNSSSRTLRSQPGSRIDKAEHSGHLVTEMDSLGSRSSRTRHESCEQDQASRRRFEMALVASAKSPSPKRSKASNPKKVDGSLRAVLGTNEASIRGFKIDLGSQDEPLEKAVEMQGSDSGPVVLEALPENLPVTPLRSEGVEVEFSEPCNREQNADVNADVSQGLPSTSKATSEKSVSSGGFRSIRFRNKSGKQEKDVGSQGNRVFPSEKHPVEKLAPPTKDPKAVGAGFSYSMLFSGKKQGDKKEGTDKGEALVMKRTDSTLMRSLLRRPSSTPGPSTVTTTKSGSQCNAKQTMKPSKKVIVEVKEQKVESAKVEATLDLLLLDGSSEEALSPNQKQFDKTKDGSFVQTKNRSIDDVFPELPLEENDVGGESPDLKKTIKAVEEQFSGLVSQGETEPFDCQSIERMFGKGFSKAYVSASSRSPDFSSLKNPAPETSPVSPEVFVTECASVPGTFPNSPLVKYEKIFFSSRNHLNLQLMFEVVSGDSSHDLTSRRHSFCLSDPRERVLASSNGEDAAADLDTCSTRAVYDTGGTPERLEIQKKAVDAGWSEYVMVTPPALKKFEEKLAKGSLYADVTFVEECGQPSPVSVLENPFLDEVPTTPDTSLAGSQMTDLDVNDVEPSPREEDEKLKQKSKTSMPESKIAEVASIDMIETEKIKQALRDISRFRNIDVTRIGLEPPTIAPVDPEQEQNYVREVLDAANLLREGESSWYSADSLMNHSMFDRLEFGSINLDKRTLMESKRWGTLPDAPRHGSSIRLERKLLFDSVNEVMVLEPWMKTSSFYVDLPMFPDLHSNSKFRAPISGEPLVKEVYKMINHWRDIAGNVLDDLIDYDMNVPEGRWVDFSHEVANIGLDIERMLMTDIVEEVASMLATRALTSSTNLR